ncbi:hypothetical protein B6N60_01021 [Richelia sinica FACHB-800]|uniref:Uncharacterized protein n=1 Tax=Richelia sinica FACHB-800 TaxID=1357546 RepID=A0A975T534_9NOST|nr:hypothetical protein [Richelia sinica]MBD2664910.1 hypothetical protein [Richelia sinica FACHB-800]QXE22338.1 hypothetical protein B6N60_01021 [Richelia sinica FACHB-800]
MASIAIHDLRPAGADLFVGTENFMNDLVDDQLNTVNGGLSPVAIWGVAIASEYVIGAFAVGVGAGIYTAW